MRYYKIINESSIIGVVTEEDFYRFQAKHQITLSCNVENGEYVYYNNVFYHSFWMKEIITDVIPYVECTIILIEEEEYNSLLQSLALEEKIKTEEPETYEEIKEESNTEENQTPETILINVVNEYTKRLDAIEAYMKELKKNDANSNLESSNNTTSIV